MDRLARTLVSAASVVSRAHLGDHEVRPASQAGGGGVESAEEARRRVLQAFGEHGPAVYRLALVLLRHHHDAEDVLQETFLKLLRHLEHGAEDRNLRGWLFTVAAHACRDRGRFRLRWVPWAAVHERSAPPEATEEDDERHRRARQALERLSVRDRLLVMLRAQGLSYRGIAEAAGLRPTSVGQLLSRALARWERAYAEGSVITPNAGRRSS
jgi:RNA polymerase sigma-70 factor (ECF subfamily)